MANANAKGAVHINIIVEGQELVDGDCLSFSVDRDLNQPDMAVVVLNNYDNKYSEQCNPGQSVEILVNGSTVKLFIGEIVGLEPIYKGKGESRIVLRCFNKLHRLLRGRVSRTFNEMSDRAILQKICADRQLTLEWEGPEITHKVVYQHNQTDLEFLRMRASRLGLNVWGEDRTVFVKRPKLDIESGVKYSLQRGTEGENQIRTFMPKLSSAPIVKKVTVVGWDEEKKERIVGEALSEESKLGGANASTASGELGASDTFTVDHPIRSIEEAKELAKGRLLELSLGYMTAELEVLGNDSIALSSVVSVTVNPKAKDKFNGKYFVVGVSHRYVPDSDGGDGGFVTTARLARNAEVSEADKSGGGR